MPRTKKEALDETVETTEETTEIEAPKTVNPCTCGNPKKPEFCTNCN